MARTSTPKPRPHPQLPSPRRGPHPLSPSPSGRGGTRLVQSFPSPEGRGDQRGEDRRGGKRKSGESAPVRVKFTRNLLAWSARAARDLPWRKTRDPYRVLVSEFMLQQTQEIGRAHV